jgi:putative oxygen-independent coproporphyrinogen III oxidase
MRRLQGGPGEHRAPGLYVHAPFCRSKCTYCDFYSVTDPALIPAWLKAVGQEISLYAREFSAFDTLYLGGGTPSLLAEPELASLLETILQRVSLAPDSEITLEANPDDLTPEKLQCYRHLGVTRLSLGVQSFDDAELRFLGRRHTAGQSREAIRLARAAGFANLSLDLIYGLPEQTLADWERNLATALSLAPEHLSCYQLTVEPGTELARRQRGTALWGEERERELFLCTSAYLTGQGYLHYEISNFARGEAHVSRHNLKYWRRAPYLGLGPAAHSFDGVRRWWNHRSLAAYCRALAAGEAPVAERETLSEEQARLERLYLGFRTAAGVDLAAMGNCGRESAVFADLQRQGLLRLKDGRAVPTIQGFLLADRLPLLFED